VVPPIFAALERSLNAPQGYPLTVGAGAAWHWHVSRAAPEWISPLALTGSHRRRLSGLEAEDTCLRHRLFHSYSSMRARRRQSRGTEGFYVKKCGK
jgi:hypothetical protein